MSTTIDLRKFLARELGYGKYDYTRSFVRGGWEYATDGRVMVRIPSPAPNSDAVCPNVTKVMKQYTGGLAAWPADPRRVMNNGYLCVKIDGRFFQKQFVDLIRTLPNVKYRRGSRRGIHPLLFKFDGGEGAVMPVNPEKRNAR